MHKKKNVHFDLGQKLSSEKKKIVGSVFFLKKKI